MTTPLFISRVANWARDNLLDLVAFSIMIAGVVTIAGILFADYFAAPDFLWRDFYHDRNSHYAFGLDLALAVRHFDVIWFFSELDKAKVWPPFHGLVLAGFLLIGGIDRRLAILPSLTGWVMTMTFVWLIARRLFRDRLDGLVAAATATILTAASPAFRLISADVMLEGLGAGLSAFALYAYLRAFTEPESRANWRLLALILTALFFHKGNYWGLVLASLAISLASEHIAWILLHARTLIANTNFFSVAKRAVREPLLILFILLAALIFYLYWRGPTAITLFERRISLYPPENLTTLAYASLFVWSAIIWKRHRAAIENALGTGGKALLYWHVVPVAISFLLPRRLSSFLWFVGPANNGHAAFDVSGGLQFYWNAFAEGFNLAPWIAIFTVIFAAIGATQFNRLLPGARVVFIFTIVAFAAVIIHPQHQGRFLTSWVFAVWLCAGVGASVLLSFLLRQYSQAVRAVAGTALVATLLVTSLWYKTPAAAYANALHPVSGPTDLGLVRPYLSELDGVKEAGFATTFGMSKLFAWMAHEHCRCNLTIDDPYIDNARSRQEVRDLMLDRIEHSRASVFVIIDAPNGRYQLPVLGWVYPKMAGILDAMEIQTRYRREKNYDLAGQGARATIWRLR